MLGRFATVREEVLVGASGPSEGVGQEMVRAGFGTAVLADLDNLKVVNDRHGHPIGDKLIRRAADVLRSTLRPYDKLYRWGGDEFLLLLTCTFKEAVITISWLLPPMTLPSPALVPPTVLLAEVT